MGKNRMNINNKLLSHEFKHNTHHYSKQDIIN